MTWIEDAQNSLGDYYLAVNPGYSYVPYQQEKIIPKLEAVERGEITRLMIFMPPGHAKSDIATRTFIPWFLGRNPTKNAMSLSYSKDLAVDDFGSRIKERMGNATHQKIFPDSKLSKDSNSKSQFRTIKGGTFYAAGFDGGIAGKRVDGLVIDDPIKNDEEADSDARMRFLIDTYKSVVKSRLRPHGKLVLCMHRWRIRDFAGRLLEMEGLAEEGGDWTVLKIPAEDPPGSENFIWEDFYGKKPYLDAKKYEDVWASMWMQDPAMSQSFWFLKDWLQYFDIPLSPTKFNNYMIVDPAGAKTKKSDYTSMHVWSAGQDKKLFLSDWIHDRLDPGERAQAILRLCRKWNPQQLLYEEYGLVNDTFYLREKMEAEGMRVYPIAIGRAGKKHNVSKAERIRSIRPFFAEGRIFLPRHMERLMYDGTKVDLVKRFIDEEYSLYKGENSIKHEDDLDCMSRLTEEELLVRYYEGEEISRPRKPAYAGSSWESVY